MQGHLGPEIIYKTGLGLGPKIRQSPNSGFLTSFKLPKSGEAPERVVVSSSLGS